MLDLLFIVVLIAFFALMVGFVKLCERIIGPGSADTGRSTTIEGSTPDPIDNPSSPEEVSA
jgi:hypothetical protein